MTMDKLELPIGQASFRSIRKWGFYYVDKTHYIHSLARIPGYYFLSRPRRFGKSLLVDTLHELFAGSEELFRGLYIHERWDWEVKHSVVRLSFDGKYSAPGELEKDIIEQLEGVERQYGLDAAVKSDSGPRRLRNIIERLYRKTGQTVVVLVDEYDKPILETLENRRQAEENRDELRGFYGMIKGCARYIRFVFVTGISMYSKVSLFSNLNNLNDISLVPRYATICGYTDTDLETVFAPEWSELPEEDHATIRKWYNGYHWLGEEKVYNPFDILLYFQSREFEPYWYKTGTPTFLYQRMKEGALNPLDLQNLNMFDRDLSGFDLELINVNALLFQCGYLTIVKKETRYSRSFYTLDYPNHEVRLSLNEELLGAVGGLVEVSERGERLIELLDSNDFEGFERELKALFAGIPYQITPPLRGSDFAHDSAFSAAHQGGSDVGVARFEGYYASILYACFCILGLDIRAEESTHKGRSDMVLRRKDQVFVLELKVAEGSEVEAKAEQALVQMRDKDYAGKYRTGGQRVHLLAVVFDRRERNLAMVRVEGV